MRYIIFIFLLTDSFSIINSTCPRLYYVKEGQSCQEIRILNVLSEEEFFQLNPSVDCESLQFGDKLCLKRRHPKDPILGSNSPSYKSKKIHEIPELRFGVIKFGNQTLNVDLNLEKSRSEVKEYVQLVFSSIDLSVKTGDAALQLSETLRLGIIAGKAAKIIQVVSIISVPTAILGTVVGTGANLLLPDPIEEFLKELKTVLLKEFGKLHVLFDKVLYRMDFHDFRAHVYDKIESGMHLLKKLWKVNTANNLNAFKNWCATHPPNDLTRKMLDRITGGTSILESLMVATNYDENIHTKVEGWLENLLQSLAILSGSCERLYPTDSEKAIQDEFAEILRKILFEMAESKARLFRRWPVSVKDLVEKAIDANPNNNDKLVVEIFNQLKQKFVGFFYVAVRDGEWGAIGCDSKSHLTFGKHYKEKIYRIARSTCQKPLTDPPTPFPFSTSFLLPTTENVVEYYKPKYCNTSSMIYAAVRETLLGYSYFRNAYDTCAVYAGRTRGEHHVIDYVIVPE